MPRICMTVPREMQGVLAQEMVKSVVPEMERSPTTNWIFRDR